jgi:hypothetical protein
MLTLRINCGASWALILRRLFLQKNRPTCGVRFNAFVINRDLMTLRDRLLDRGRLTMLKV